MESSFFSPGTRTSEGQLASLHLSRDQQLPVILSTTVARAEDEGYAEGVVTNTRFGSFPHSTLINVPWGSQVLASKVDTGSRGRKETAQSKKRKAGAISTDSPIGSVESPHLKEATVAASGFVHVLPPTPESWTSSLPHRTQVVYTPDYSYILHRIRARPGSILIEAGSGSGSFTHAAARAVFDGSKDDKSARLPPANRTSSRGQVYTYEFHVERHEKVRQEMKDHKIDGMVTATHRDVYKEGFLLGASDVDEKQSPFANAIFLDLPAPWEALQHLTRANQYQNPSPLDPLSTVHICTFSPCIEQVQKTVSSLRRYGWVDIEMVEMQHKRIDVRREYTGLKYDGMRSVNAIAVNVDEAMLKLREVEDRSQDLQSRGSAAGSKSKKIVEQNKQQDAAKLLYKEGRVIHRSEPELKTHTSYLVFAILPRDWTESDEIEVRRQLMEQKLYASGGQDSQSQANRKVKQKEHLPNGTAKATLVEINDGEKDTL